MRNVSLFLALSFGLSLAAQTYELESDEMKGQIIMKDGTVLTGYVKLKGDIMHPWNNQESVEFFTEEAMQDGKVKRNEREKYKPKDIQAYMAGDRYFESMKISIAKMSLGIGIASYAFAERMVEGNMTMYHFYNSPDALSVTTTEEERVAREQELEEMRTKPNIVLKKGEEDMVLLERTNFVEYLASCPSVQAKYLNGEYGFEPYNPNAESGLGKLVAKAQDSANLIPVLPEIIRDFNNCTN